MTTEFDACPLDGESDPMDPFVKPDPQLLADGWVRRHFVDFHRAEESAELYRSMGYEVVTRKPSPADFDAKCKQCASTLCGAFVLVYTRKKKPSS